MQFPRKRRRSPMINIIPLIDVLVVLLIFYIATTVFKKAQPIIKIIVPQATTAKPTEDTPPTIVYVTADSKIFVGDKLVEGNDLATTLKDLKAANPNFKLAMKSDENAPFGAVVKVMDAAHIAGIDNLQTFANPDKPSGGNGQ